MGQGVTVRLAISSALISGVDGGVGVRHPAEEKMEQGDMGRALEPRFLWGHPYGDPRRWCKHRSRVQAIGGPTWGPQESPPVLCPGHGCCWAHFSPKILGWKSSSLLRVHPKGGMARGSTLWVPNLGAAPTSQPAKPSHVVMGEEMGF